MTVTQPPSPLQDMPMDLDASFRAVVTDALDDVLHTMPAQPVAALAEHLRARTADYVNDRHTCVLQDGALVATLTPASVRRRGADLREVPGLPLASLVNPNVYEIEAALRRFDSARVVLIVEPAAPPVDLLFVHGVPYCTDVTAQLLSQRRRRGRCGEFVESPINNAAGDDAHIAALVAKALGNTNGVSTLRGAMNLAAEGMKKNVDIVELPRVRVNTFGVFDTIHAALRVFSETPAVLHVSYMPASAVTTFARVIATVLPIHEATQRRRLAKAREEGVARISELSHGVLTDYWRDVLRRRDERDSARAARRPGLTPIKQKNARELQTARVRRREQEDVAFLRAALLLRGAAATRIQAAWRGFHWRCALRRAVGVIRGTCAMSQSIRRQLGFACANNAPSGVPPLLSRVADRLIEVHGELFGHYNTSPPPVPRRVALVRPVCRRIPAIQNDDMDEIDSEAEEFVIERVTLPVRRQTCPPPHINPLRRLMECEHIAGSDTAAEAVTVLRECGGLSVLHRRAYDRLKGLVLSLLYIAFLELYHRHELSLLVNSFSAYVHKFHAEVLAWLSAPHMFSRIAARSSPDTSILCDKETILTERVLVGPSTSLGGCYAPPEDIPGTIHNGNGRKQPQEKCGGGGGEGEGGGTADEEKKERTNKEELSPNNYDMIFDNKMSTDIPSSHDFNVCESVRVAPSFLSVYAWESTLRNFFMSGILCVSWWSLHPHPAVYLRKEPFILEPRGEKQQVEGRRPFDEFAHFIVARVPRKATSVTLLPKTNSARVPLSTPLALPYCPASTQPLSSMAMAMTMSSPALLGTSISTSHRGGYVADGLITPMGKEFSDGLTPIRLAAYEVTIPDPRDGEVQLSPFVDATLTTEDAWLAREINKKPQLPLFMRRAPLPPPFGVSATAPHAPFTVEMSQLVVYTPSEYSRYHSASLTETRSVKRPSSQSAPLRNSLSVRSGKRRLEYRLIESASLPVSTGDGGADLSVSRSHQSTTLLMTPRDCDRSAAVSSAFSNTDPHPRSASPAQSLVRPVDEVAKELAARVGYDGGSFLHERPWLTHVCGRAFLLVFEKFIIRSIDRLCSGYTLVMALDDPLQLIYFHSACLLKFALRQSVEARAQSRSFSMSNLEVCHNNCGDENSQLLGRPSALLSPEANIYLASLGPFLTYIADATRIGIESVSDAFYIVLSVIRANSPGGLAFVENIVGMVRAAEEETNPRRLEDIIITIVRRVEQLCWLILLQVFIVSPASVDAFSSNFAHKLPSFASFVDYLDVIPLIDRIDPWAAVPERSPDPFHLRYSNGLRRWDDRSYISQGII